MSASYTNAIIGKWANIGAVFWATVSYQDQSGEKILQELQELQSLGVYYAANKQLNTLCEFISNKGVKGDVLIEKDCEKPNSEFILARIFQIDMQNFFMTSDRKWNQTINLEPILNKSGLHVI